MLDAETLARKHRDAGEERAEAYAALKLMEDTEKTVLAQHTQKYLDEGAKSVAAAESLARACPEFDEFIQTKGKVRLEYSLADVKYESMRVYIDMLRANQALERAQMALV
tara:strand:- start:706 stop:1035 length:330 start_codon:yes stop_codon:yes gene_type:complete